MQVVPRILRPVLYRTPLFFGKETDMNLEEVYGIKDEIEQIRKPMRYSMKTAVSAAAKQQE